MYSCRTWIHIQMKSYSTGKSQLQIGFRLISEVVPDFLEFLSPPHIYENEFVFYAIAK